MFARQAREEGICGPGIGVCAVGIGGRQPLLFERDLQSRPAVHANMLCVVPHQAVPQLPGLLVPGDLCGQVMSRQAGGDHSEVEIRIICHNNFADQQCADLWPDLGKSRSVAQHCMIDVMHRPGRRAYPSDWFDQGIELCLTCRIYDRQVDHLTVQIRGLGIQDEKISRLYPLVCPLACSIHNPIFSQRTICPFMKSIHPNVKHAVPLEVVYPRISVLDLRSTGDVSFLPEKKELRRQC